MIFNGMFNNMKPEHIVALLSCFVFEEKSKDYPTLPEELSNPLRQMHVRKLKALSLSDPLRQLHVGKIKNVEFTV